jgi:drug/metabolite transporter (DMT)-like permease
MLRKGFLLGICCALGYATVGLLGNILEDEGVSLWAIMCLSGWFNTIVILTFFLVKTFRLGQPLTFSGFFGDALGPKRGYPLSEIMALALFGAGSCDLAAFDTGLGIAIVTAIDYLSVAWSVLIGSCILHEKITRVQLIGVIICLAGTVGVAGVFDSIVDDSLAIIWEGVAFAIGASVFYSGLFISNVFLHKVVPEQTTAQRSSWMFFNRAIFGTILMFLTGAESELPSSVYHWCLMFVYSFTILFTMALLVITSKVVSSAVLNVLMTFEVFFTLIYQVWVFEDTPGTWAIVCIFIQVIGVVLVQPKEDEAAVDEATITTQTSEQGSSESIPL